MIVALAMAERSTCPDRHVGAVIVSPDRQILSTGYNGAPAGLPHCTDVGCIALLDGKCGRAIHAEINAMIYARHEIHGATLYVTARPCYACASAIVNAGIRRVYYLGSQHRPVPRDRDPLLLLAAGGVEATLYKMGGDPALHEVCTQ
jgi:dCMP deaminase